MPLLERSSITGAGRLALWVVLSAAVSACGAHHRPDVRFERPEASQAGTPADSPVDSAIPTVARSSAPVKIVPAVADRNGSLETFMNKVRELSVRARPERTDAPTIETSDPRLRAALAASLAAPSPESLRAVAAEYLRVGVLDRAHGALERALQLRPADPLTHDAMARLWRDEGSPNLALGDAYRAVHYSRGSAGTRNTLGTVLQALGRNHAAVAEFAAVVAKQPDAAYGWNNLCYSSIADGKPAEATEACRKALRLAPDFAAAQNNLGLARAQAGDFTGAAAAFNMAGNSPRADFNMGMARAATGQYGQAASAFERAHRAVPQWRDAALLAWQAGRASRAVAEGSVIE
jgi:tetratricopeptide (TPR) repeat protein